MDLCRYYWKDKVSGSMIDKCNRGTLAADALREKTKSFVYIEMNMGIEIEWWDVGHLLPQRSAKVLLNKRTRPLSQLAKSLSISRILWRFSK